MFKSESAAYRLFRDRAQCSDFELSFRVFLVKVAAGSEMVVWFVLRRMFDHSLPECAVCCGCFCLLLFCFEVEVSSRALIPLFRPGSVHSGFAS